MRTKLIEYCLYWKFPVTIVLKIIFKIYSFFSADVIDNVKRYLFLMRYRLSNSCYSDSDLRYDVTSL